jgi:hypothetical protein
MNRPYSLDPLVEYDNYDEYEDYEEYGDEYADFGGEPPDRRWLWVAGVAAVVLILAVIGTVSVIGGDDSGSVSATVVAPTTSRPAATSSAAPTTTASPPVATSLPPETVTTVTPSPTASAETSTEVPAPPAPRTVTYRVTGNRQLIDLVTVIYTDQQGALQTEVNVALPWTKSVALDPGVELSSVTATSVAGQLNCSITDGGGATVAAQNNNAMIATCTK